MDDAISRRLHALSAEPRSARTDFVEMLGVAYEVSGDTVHNRDRLAAYRDKYNVAWEVVAAENGPDRLFEGPARLSPIDGVPATIFLNRDRTIHAIYAGFRGPAMRAEHQEAAETFRRLTRQILESAKPKT